MESHHLVSVRNAAHVITSPAPRTGPRLHGFSVLLESGNGFGQVLQLEYHLYAARERLWGPACAEYDLHHVARRVAFRKLGQSGEEGVWRTGRRPGGAESSPVRTVLIGHGRRRLLLGFVFLGFLSYVFEGFDGVSATS
eukprot:TRINITY_DN27006_c0_g1_i1.p2 TRINITY_DN27006_c0_g1~~TRINITY_DN27006_c0_g1_i1.p2  ORF type:complete len:139 (-),score=4.26 TRINITY_DN27006_c0_g1_i1:126-542(-)